jgi:hypothetical protein
MNLITVGLIAALSAALACGSSAEASQFAPVGCSSILVGSVDSFGSSAPASLAWAGENETLVDVQLVPVSNSADDVNIEMVTPIAAPEPPAIVLAGMALGGVLCGRSLLKKKQRKAVEEDRS